VTVLHQAPASAAAALRRRLGLLGTMSISIGVMAPTLAMSITGPQPAALLGRAAPLAYVFAAIGVALVAYGFVRLAGEVASAGSVYAFVAHAAGERAGFVAGWAMLGTYLVFPAVSISAFAVFGVAFLHHTGIADHAAWLPIGLVGWALVFGLATRDVQTAARSLLGFEGVAVVLILVLMAIIVIQLAGGDAPRGQDLNTDFLRVPAGIPASTIALAATAGFLSFAGFESAGSFGEEAQRPTTSVPRAIVTAIALGAVFYVACEIVQTLGFGTDAAGVRTFASSGAPLGDLANAYVGSGMAALLDFVALISAIGAGLGCASVGGRMLFAMGRERRLPAALARISPGTGAPIAGLAFVGALDLAGIVAFGIAGTAPMTVFAYFATVGILSLLVMYALSNLAAARHLGGLAAVPCLLGLAIALYTLYRNVWPRPPSPFDVFPYVVAAWLLTGVALSLRRT
jgi:amino acid transporter